MVHSLSKGMNWENPVSKDIVSLDGSMEKERKPPLFA